MDIKDFDKEPGSLMKKEDIKVQYLKYNSFYNHTRQYYRFGNQYKNKVPLINGTRQGKDINLYKLFLEQTFNLLKDNADWWAEITLMGIVSLYTLHSFDIKNYTPFTYLHSVYICMTTRVFSQTLFVRHSF